MKKTLLILPYFGKLPNYFSIFLKSLAMNAKIDLLLITDDKVQLPFSNHVRTVYSSFYEIVQLFKAKISENISLDVPYKLCDFKPCYGHVFSEYLTGYDYWGYCDCDVVFGDVSKFVSQYMDQDFDKIFVLGHLSFIRNTEANNKLFYHSFRGELLYKEALFNSDIFWFDESYKNDGKDINSIFVECGKTVCFNDVSINPECDKAHFHQLVFNYEKRFFNKISEKPFYVLWDNGKLYKVKQSGKSIVKEEFCYMHLQRRKMSMPNHVVGLDSFAIIPDRFYEFKKEKNIPSTSFMAYWNVLTAIAKRIKRKLAKVLKRKK